MKVKHRLTWRNEPNETGLALGCQAPRGKELRVDGEKVGHASPYPIGFHKWAGWYWCARGDRFGVELYNSCAVRPKEIFDTMPEAMAACEAYVRRQLGAPQKAGAK